MHSISTLAALLLLSVLVPTSSANAQDAKPATADAKTGVPFDATSLDLALKGMRAFKTKMADAAALSARHTEAEQKITALHATNPNIVDNYASARDAITKCVRAFTGSRASDLGTRVQKKVMAISSDQAALEKFSADYSRVAQALTAATASKDSKEGDLLKARKAEIEGALKGS